ANQPLRRGGGPPDGGGGGGGAGGFHQRLGPEDFARSLERGVGAVAHNLVDVMILTCATNLLILAIPIYLFQISDRVLTSRSVDTLIMLTVVIVGAVVFHAVFDAIRRFMLMRTAVKVTARPFGDANAAQSRANLHLGSMSRNSQIINALAMVPELVVMWGRDTAASLTAQVRAQDRNIVSAAISRGVRLLTQIAILGWGAFLAIQGEITGGMVIAASIIAGRALAPIEGAIEGWNAFSLTRSAYGRIAQLLTSSASRYEKLRLPRPEGRLDVERLLFVPFGTKQVVLNGISFALAPGESLAVIGNSGAGKTTLGKMLVGSIVPTSGNVRLDLMDLRNWDPRQFGESIGYLPQDVQLFPGTIKANIARMRADARDDQIYDAAVLAEPNSNLDVAGDKALARALEHAKANGITVVIITQKPQLLSVVDKVMLLKDGTVALFGQRDVVLKRLNESRGGGDLAVRGGGSPDG
ncbi:MAG: type I secretion system permease/ATPase, partial [Alphaproteobacteria bacterium]